MARASLLRIALALVAPYGVVGGFGVVCPAFANAYMDPLVAPYRKNGHVHSIAGSVGFKDHVDAAAQRSASTTCDILGDKSVYWAPTLFHKLPGTDEAMSPVFHVYYMFRRYYLSKYDPRNMAGPLGIVAGHSTYMDSAHITFKHITSDGAIHSNKGFFPSSAHNVRYIAISYDFPQCWNGKSRDSKDSHVKYADPVKKSCPASHPKYLPMVTMEQGFWLKGFSGWSGGAPFYFSNNVKAHADAIFLWDVNVLRSLINKCANTKVSACHPSVPMQSKDAGFAVAKRYTVPVQYRV